MPKIRYKERENALEDHSDQCAFARFPTLLKVSITKVIHYNNIFFEKLKLVLYYFKEHFNALIPISRVILLVYASLLYPFLANS